MKCTLSLSDCVNYNITIISSQFLTVLLLADPGRGVQWIAEC